MAEDVHFYIDNAPPEEAMYVLRSLTKTRVQTSEEIAGALSRQYGFEMQRDKSYSPRRLFDLGLASRVRSGSSYAFGLSPTGVALQAISSTNRALGFELLHLLHYYGYSGQPDDRKLFWTYRKICELVWADGRIRSSREIASEIQSEIVAAFASGDHSATRGYRFASSGVNQALAWLRVLDPSPLQDSLVVPRENLHPTLAVVVLDYFYKEHGLALGDSVTLTDEVLGSLVAPMFVSRATCRNMLETSSVLLGSLSFSETLGGTSVRLSTPFTVTDLAGS